MPGHWAWAHLETTIAKPELMFSLSSPEEERGGERRPLLLNAPLPFPLPTRASRGEGENFWWLCQDAPIRPWLLNFLFVPRGERERISGGCVKIRPLGLGS